MHKTKIRCQTCQKEMEVWTYLVEKKNKKYCSRACMGASKRGKPSAVAGRHWTLSEMVRAKYKKNKNFLGHTHTAATRALISAHRTGITRGPQNYQWKGQDVSYRALHHWVTKQLGRPKICKNCGARDLRDRQYQWANISHTYLRDANDWMRLCAKCHKAYDTGRLALAEIGG